MDTLKQTSLPRLVRDNHSRGSRPLPLGPPLRPFPLVVLQELLGPSDPTIRTVRHRHLDPLACLPFPSRPPEPRTTLQPTPIPLEPPVAPTEGSGTRPPSLSKPHLRRPCSFAVVVFVTSGGSNWRFWDRLRNFYSYGRRDPGRTGRRRIVEEPTEVFLETCKPWFLKRGVSRGLWGRMEGVEGTQVPPETSFQSRLRPGLHAATGRLGDVPY